MKISLKRAMLDMMELILGEVLRRDHIKNHEEFRDIVYGAMFEIALDYADRCDDVAVKDMSLEIDRLNQTVTALRGVINARENDDV